MFCSEDCKEELYSKAHEFQGIQQLGLKIFSWVADKFGGKENLDRFLDGVDLKTLKSTIFDYDFSDPKNEKYQENLAICFLSLCSHDSGIGKSLDLSASYTTKALSEHMINIHAINSFECTYCDAREEIFEDGVCTGLFQSLLNHSCDSNAYCFMADNKVVTYLCKPIKAGEQILYNYS